MNQNTSRQLRSKPERVRYSLFPCNSSSHTNDYVQGKVRSRKYAIKHNQRTFQLTVGEPWAYAQGKSGLKWNFFVIPYRSLFWKLLFADITWKSSSFSVAIWRTSPISQGIIRGYEREKGWIIQLSSRV
jgi:hypothetical protein